MGGVMMQLGESFVGSGPEAAHLNTVLGLRSGPVGTAWATALATPGEGHAGFVVVAQPNLPVKPMTLFVNKATIASEIHGRMTWGPAQLGVASGVLDAVADGVVEGDEVDRLVLIAAVWVDPSASDADLVYENNRQATREALRNGALSSPSLAEVMAVRETPLNGYYTPPTLRGPAS
jgi:5,6,7,8-tetrahydromethanopterin hydro-lyase